MNSSSIISAFNIIHVNNPSAIPMFYNKHNWNNKIVNELRRSPEIVDYNSLRLVVPWLLVKTISGGNSLYSIVKSLYFRVELGFKKIEVMKVNQDFRTHVENM